ncbi:MAG: hemolysin III [Oxalobacteraceae bacterium]|nr:MAG: hemolysin III [Oxalobacteraceae bacterium]
MAFATSPPARSQSPAAAPNPKVRPRFRGIPDVVAALAAVPAVALLIRRAHAGVCGTAASIYGTSLILLFATSAIYHAFYWPLHVRDILKRFDHAMVYVLIAGSYTPVALAALPPRPGLVLLSMVWAVALLGIVKSFVWTTAPRLLNTAIYIAMGWLVLPFLPSVYRGLGAFDMGLLATGGVVYTLGGLIYARRWPNPDPRTFGYHEVFHLFVIAAAACHFATMWKLLT